MELFSFEKPSLIDPVKISRVDRERESPGKSNVAARPSFQRVRRRKPGAGSLVVRQGPMPNGAPPEESGDRTSLILAVFAVLFMFAGVLWLFDGDDTVETADEAADTEQAEVADEPEDELSADEENETQTGLQRAVERVSTQGADTPASNADSTTTTTAVASNTPVTSPRSTEPASNVPLEASFVAETGDEGSEQSVAFRSTSVGPVDTVSWDFGDGTTGSGPVTFHTYGNPGNYTVTMTVRGGDSADSMTQDLMVNPISGRVDANFAASVPDPARSQTIFFGNTSHQRFESFVWNFGDGSSSTERSPTHSYRRPGDYAVLLTATMPDGSADSTTYSIRVAANTGNLDASFSAFPSDSPTQQRMNFRSTSEGDIARWDWTWGDGNTGAGQNPEHHYAAPGTYTVTLTIRNNNGASDTATQEVIVPLSG